METPTKPFDLMVLRHSYEAFGMVMDLLSRDAIFGKFEVGDLSAAVRLQLRLEHHVAAVSDASLVGYLGWLAAPSLVAEAWAQGRGPLTPDAEGDAVALTVIMSADNTVTKALIRNARQRNAGKRVFFKRTGKRTRKVSVLNRVGI